MGLLGTPMSIQSRSAKMDPIKRKMLKVNYWFKIMLENWTLKVESWYGRKMYNGDGSRVWSTNNASVSRSIRTTSLNIQVWVEKTQDKGLSRERVGRGSGLMHCVVACNVDDRASSWSILPAMPLVVSWLRIWIVSHQVIDVVWPPPTPCRWDTKVVDSAQGTSHPL